MSVRRRIVSSLVAVALGGGLGAAVDNNNVYSPLSEHVQTIDYSIGLNSSELEDLASRTISVGAALDGTDQDRFVQEVNQANIRLHPYGIYLSLDEVQQVFIPSSFDSNELVDGIIHSFDKPHDYYFSWTGTDFSKSDLDYFVKSLVREQVSLIDADVDEKDLDWVITHETLRFVSGRANENGAADDGRYFAPFPVDSFHAHFLRPTKDEPYKIDSGHLEERVVTVNLSLDGVSESYALEMMERASLHYKEHFNITFEVIGVTENPLSDSWDVGDERRAIKREAEEVSNIYILFTEKDWQLGGRDPAGVAYRRAGFTWIETDHSDETVLNITLHEIAHLFGAHHVYRLNAMMNPVIQSEPNWTPRSIETILQNRDKAWNVNVYDLMKKE